MAIALPSTVKMVIGIPAMGNEMKATITMKMSEIIRCKVCVVFSLSLPDLRILLPIALEIRLLINSPTMKRLSAIKTWLNAIELSPLLYSGKLQINRSHSREISQTLLRLFSSIVGAFLAGRY